MTDHSSILHRLYFSGKGSKYFGIWAVNIILTILTLGLYYPWAKIAVRKYLWNETSIEEDRFVFHGTGKELFRGFIIVYLIFAVLIGIFFLYPMSFLLLYLVIYLLIPYAVFGAWRYRLSKTSWRGIYFTFNGRMREFFNIFIWHGFLVLITFGIYSSWFRVKIMKYLFSHTKFGQYELDFDGEGDELFSINIVGMILTVVTLGIYTPWYIAKRFNFTIRNIAVYHNGDKSYLMSKLTGGDLFALFIVNGLIVTFTLGLGIPWAIMRYYKLIVESVAIPGEVDLDNLEQNFDDFNDATGDDLLDILDVGFDF